MKGFIDTLGRGSSELSRFSTEISELNLEHFAERLRALSRDTGDLDAVLDSMITILDRKMEEVPV